MLLAVRHICGSTRGDGLVQGVATTQDHLKRAGKPLAHWSSLASAGD